LLSALPPEATHTLKPKPVVMWTPLRAKFPTVLFLVTTFLDASVFAAASVNTDDFFLMAPFASAIRGTSAICEQFATKYYAMFHKTKSKLVYSIIN